MPQTHKGAMRALAKKRGMTIEALLQRFETENFCYGCQQWKPHASFGIDASRWNGLARKCNACRYPVIDPAMKPPRPPSPLRGRTMSTEARAKMSAAQLGNQKRRGKPCSPEQRRRQSRYMLQHARRGSQNPRWKGGITPLHAALRASPEYVNWRKQVFERDGYTCQRCGDATGGNLHAHHVKSFSDYPALRFEVGNGITLCETCHWEEHSRPVSDETIYLVEVAMKYAFDMFGSVRAVARAFGLSPRTVKLIAVREGRFAE